ncbi:MAG: helix-turn-helix transcriptional regulator, partial [Clostridium lundense]|nr:helix-turn-helix transcriptional regulator [Clostridium lundense]
VIAVVVLRLLPRGVSVASLFVLPLVAAFLLKRVYGQPICMDAVTGDFREPGTMRAFAPLAVSMFVFVAASAALRSLLEGHAASEWLLHWQTTFVDAVVAILFFVIYLVFKRMDPMPVYRCVIPLIVVGYMVFPLLPGEQRVIGAMFAATGYGLFDLLSWVVMARFVHDGRGKPLQVFGIGVGVTLAGRSFGCVAADMCLGLQAQGMLDLSTVSLVMMFVLVLVCFLVLPERALIHVSAEASAGASAGSDQLRAACMRLADEKGLTPRETDVLLPLSRGRNAQAIARELQIASGTAQTHIKHIYTKTGVHNQQELIDLLEHMGA